VWLFDDAALDVLHLAVAGHRRDEVAAALRAGIPTYSAADMPGLFAEARSADEVIDRVGLAAAVAPETADPALVGLFRQAFAHPDDLVREAALLAASVSAWLELRPDIDRRASGGHAHPST
jgi:hypothetical protein